MKISRVMKMLRAREWLFSKAPFLFLPLLICINDLGGTIKNQLGICLAFFVYLFTFLGFGYAINDFSDREIDKKVGRSNEMAKLSTWKCLCILGILVMGCIPFLIMNFSMVMLALFVFVYFWGAAYSVKPFRFKEKGVAGLLVSALAQRTIPLLPLLGVLKEHWIIVCIYGTCGFFVGMRYILIHQYEDMENDKITGTNTYVRNRNSDIAKMIYVLFAVECLLISILMVLFIKSMIAWALLFVCIIQSFISFHTIHDIYHKKYFLSFICVPFEDMYNFYLPLAVLLGLIIQNVLWIVPIIILVTISAKDMMSKWKIAAFGITHWRNYE